MSTSNLPKGQNKAHISHELVMRVGTATGAKTSLQVNDKLTVGEKFRLIGRSVTFEAISIRGVLGGSSSVVDGVSECGRYQTTALVTDTAKPIG